jgi:spore germination protein KA
MIPTPLILSIYTARQGLPFPTVVELIMMLLLFEILRESGTRLPAFMGNALSIVGALVIGQAAVDARFISAPTVIISAMAGITSLVIPRIKFPTVAIRFVLLILSAMLGLYGIAFGLIALVIHLYELRSFGVPYMQGMMAFNSTDFKDNIIRVPWFKMLRRPKNIATDKNLIRQKEPSKGMGK